VSLLWADMLDVSERKRDIVGRGKMSVELSSYRDQHFKGSRSEQERLLQKVIGDPDPLRSGSAEIRFGLGRLNPDPDWFSWNCWMFSFERWRLLLYFGRTLWK
jgi:hypothetical protein